MILVIKSKFNFIFRNIIFTVSFLTLSCLLAIVFRNIEAYISIISGYFSIVFAFILPCLLYLKSNNNEKYHWKNIGAYVLFIGCTLCGFIGATVEIIDFLREN